MVDCPCHKCEARQKGCHALCEPYQAWHRAGLEAYEAERGNRMAYSFLHDGIERAIRRRNGRR